MTLAMMELFKYSEGLVDPRLFPVDVSETGPSTLNGQKVNEYTFWTKKISVLSWSQLITHCDHNPR